MTELLTKAFKELSKLPAERQDELAQMLIDAAENHQLMAAGYYRLTAEQWAEVDAAIQEDKWLEGEELEEFFEQLMK